MVENNECFTVYYIESCKCYETELETIQLYELTNRYCLIVFYRMHFKSFERLLLA